MSLPVVTLYLEELKATMRGRFAWLGAAVILLAVGGLATVGTQDSWLDGYGIIAYGLIPLGSLGLTAAMMTSRVSSSKSGRPSGGAPWAAAATSGWLHSMPHRSAAA